MSESPLVARESGTRLGKSVSTSVVLLCMDIAVDGAVP
jgi:hypothetical protein